MTITYTGNLKLALPTTGTEAGTWGDVVNQQITALLDQSVAGTASLTSMTNADYTLTSGNGSAPNEARYMALLVPATLTLTAARNIIVPTSSKAYIIRNLTTGGFAVTLKTSAGTGISVPNGKTMILYCDGTNVIDGTDYFTSITVGALTATGNVSAAKLIPTGGTATGNGMYLPATNAIAWSNNGAETMRLDASGNLGIGTSLPGAKLDVNGDTKLSATDGKILAGTAAGRAIWGNANTSSYIVAYGASHATNPNILLFANAANTMTFDASGNLGIGTSSPSQKLTVSGRIAFSSVSTDIDLYGLYVSSDTGNSTTLSSAGATAICFRSNSTERMRLDASGNLGLGVTPDAWNASYKSFTQQGGGAISGTTGLTQYSSNMFYNTSWNYIYRTSDFATMYRQNSGVHTWWSAPSGTAGNAITFTQAMTLDASGRLLVGATSNTGTNTKLVIGAGLASTNGIAVVNTANVNIPGLMLSNWDGSATTQGPRISFDNSGRGSFTIGGSDAANNFDICQTWGTPLVRIDASGNLLVGMTTSSGKISTSFSSTQTCFYAETSNNDATYIRFNRSGVTNVDHKIVTSAYQIVNSSAGVSLAIGGTSWGAVSDERRKDIIEPIVDAASKVFTLRAVIGKYKTDDEGTRRAFLIAQDVQAVLPEAVVENNGDLILQYTDTIPLLVAAIQEQQALITSLTARITALESKA